MHFETDQIYHLFNQGNNRQKIFFKAENYLFFMEKMRTYILPYGDILAYCLMPNHFHIMLKVNRLILPDLVKNKPRSVNNSIAILLRSYTRAINKQEEISGSLFRQKTKAQCLTEADGISPAWFQTNFGTLLNQDISERNYLQICFDYIHQNPIKAGLVNSPEEWKYSSCAAYECGVENSLINRQVASIEGIQF